MQIKFDRNAKPLTEVESEVGQFLSDAQAEKWLSDSPVIIHQDGKGESYYIKCTIPASVVCLLLDLDARLDPGNPTSFRANRQLLLKNITYQRMKSDAEKGREFNDIIVEYLRDYAAEMPLKVWGGQHRSKAIQEAFKNGVSRNHGFRIYFCLSKKQRSELALISNTNINVSNDLFDRQLEETFIGTRLREWCYKVGLLQKEDDFPDQASKADKISVKLARTFIVNFFLGKTRGEAMREQELDRNIYEPYLCESGANIDPEYERIVNELGVSLWADPRLIEAGTNFARLHQAQRDAVEKSKKIENRKGFRNKALTESVLAGWSYISGLLQAHPRRLQNLYQVPKGTSQCPDPLNAKGMSTFHHDQDETTYRGLGTRSHLKDRQRMAQVFIVKSKHPNQTLDKDLLYQAVSAVIGFRVLQKGNIEI